MEIKKKMQISGKLIGGIALVLIGLLLLEDTFGFNLSGQILPLLLIAFGVIHIVRRRNKDMHSSADSHSEHFEQTKDRFYGKVNDFESKVGDFESKIGDFEKNAGEKINNFERKIDEQVNKFDKKINDFEESINHTFKSGKVKYEKAFGDLYINCKGVNVQNVEVSSAFGNIEMQMREAEYAEGLNRLIISNFIGDVQIYIPKDMPVFVNCSNFIGDVEAGGKRTTGFGNKVEHHSTDYDTAARKLYIACSSFLGNIRIISS